MPVSLFLAAASVASNLYPQFVTQFPLKGAAVSTVVDKWPGSPSPALLVTTYGVLSNPVYVVSDLASVAKTGSASPQVVEQETVWNNYVDLAPEAAFNSPTVLVTAGGFLVPTKGTGTIDLWEVSDPSAARRVKVSTDKSGWFYHHLVWYDMNGDGLLDIVAARAKASPKSGELIWLEHPKDFSIKNASSEVQWPEHSLGAGPDVDFIFEDLDNDGKPEVVAAQFFSASQLAIYSCPKSKWSDCDGSSVKSTVIDNIAGPFFAVGRVDMNMDGKLDLLVTNNQEDGTGATFVYEQPADIYADKWTRHTISGWFKPIPSLIPQPAHARGAPGSAKAFHPRVADAGHSKPWVVVSGDDEGTVRLLAPKSESADDWSYDETYLVNSSGTVGGPSVSDVDGDGISELLVPFYGNGKVQIYTFGDKPPPTPSQQCVACIDKKDPVHLSADSSWCYKDNNCYLVHSPLNPCGDAQCTSAAATSKCGCTSCNDAACHA